MIKKGRYIALIGMLISGVALFSGCRRHSHGHKAEFVVDYISETLDLNESQQPQLAQAQGQQPGSQQPGQQQGGQQPGQQPRGQQAGQGSQPSIIRDLIPSSM